ncbi:unnamed protein product [Pseudo-nitzschia multistriata]|uniref:Uncharacterized protein n=1 Tax=Pseudo-nitzschia multistriata TaxID=183589 RepID=A0A448Z4M3_9STRA|nr:unnamed protein product [Pseudo-nitzschia multistriata]
MKALQGVPDVIVEGQPSWTMVGEEAAGAAGSAGAGSAGAGSAGAGSAGAGSAGASIETGGMRSVAVQVHAAFVTVVTFMLSVSMISPPQPPLAIPAGKTPAQDSPSLGTPGRARQNSGMEELEPVGAGALTRDGVGMVAIGAGTGAGTGTGTGEEATALMTLVHWLETPPLQMYLFSPLRQLQI